ncbi:MAG: glycosyltransferase family 39 protein, partial [Thermomicrobiales bacterium]
MARRVECRRQDHASGAMGAVTLPVEDERLHEPALQSQLRFWTRFPSVPRSLWPIVAVCLVYAAAAFVIPTLAPVSISDDWTYVRSIEMLIEEGRFHVLPVAAASLVFQVFWGGLFAFLFGMSFGVLRVASVVLTFLGGLAFFGLCRELGVSRERSALGTAAYLFNPVLFTVSYSFMSDPQFLALLTISSYWYVRGLRPGSEGERATLMGAGFAALACLQRPHGALIPLGVATFLLLSGRFKLDKPSIIGLIRVAGIPALTTIVYYAV